MKPATPSPDLCPVCGATVPPRVKACPECGADERTGWDEETTYADGLDLPAESPDYDETLKETGSKPEIVPRGVALVWWLVGLAVLAAFIALALGLKA